MGITVLIMRTIVDDADIASILFGKTRKGILSLLCVNPEESFYLREIVRKVNSGVGAVQRELRLLTDAGIIQRHERGSQVYFAINRKCPVFPELQSLILKTVGVGDTIKNALLPLLARIKCAFIYGSSATGELSPDSDIDLIIVGDVSFGDIVKVISPLQQTLGREINPTVYSTKEFKEKLGSGHYFVSEVARRPKIFLMGDEGELERLAKVP